MKELRLAAIDSIDEANRFAAGFVEKFNQRFARPALASRDAHRPLLDSDVLPEVFTWKEKRKVSRALAVHYKRVMYLLQDSAEARAAIGQQVDMVEQQDGEVSIYFRGAQLKAHSLHKDGYVQQAAIVDNKVLGSALKFAHELQQLCHPHRSWTCPQADGLQVPFATWVRLRGAAPDRLEPASPSRAAPGTRPSPSGGGGALC